MILESYLPDELRFHLRVDSIWGISSQPKIGEQSFSLRSIVLFLDSGNLCGTDTKLVHLNYRMESFTGSLLIVGAASLINNACPVVDTSRKRSWSMNGSAGLGDCEQAHGTWLAKPFSFLLLQLAWNAFVACSLPIVLISCQSQPAKIKVASQREQSSESWDDVSPPFLT